VYRLQRCQNQNEPYSHTKCACAMRMISRHGFSSLHRFTRRR